MEIHVGTSGYAYKEWRGLFYPEKVSSAEMLRFYSERLDAVEINNTFYQMPRESVLTSWAQQVPDHFVFALKAPQLITHIKRLRNVDAEIDYLFSSLSVLGGKLGPLLFQFPKSFRVDLPALEGFLNQIPADARCAFAFRSPTWLIDDVLGLLRSRNCSLCFEDTDDTPVQSIISTASWGYLRLRGSDYSQADLSEWGRRVLSRDWDEAFIFFKHESEANAPMLAMRFKGIHES